MSGTKNGRSHCPPALSTKTARVSRHVACVATDVTGIPEVLRDGKTGLMVPERDAPALATALERLLDDPALRVRLASEARRLIEAEFDIHTNAAAIRKVFEPAAHAVAREVQGVG